jgi:hypothetical protein
MTAAVTYDAAIYLRRTLAPSITGNEITSLSTGVTKSF